MGFLKFIGPNFLGRYGNICSDDFSGENHQDTEGFHISQKTLSNEFGKNRLKFMGQNFLGRYENICSGDFDGKSPEHKRFSYFTKTLSNEFGKKDVGNLLDKIFLEDNVVQ